MNNIQAIETAYKGYRFRSRLEARWAMFYDRLGLPWSYEDQPVTVEGENYLPDFTVTLAGRQVVHEVKGLHEAERIVAPKVYLAGKMRPEHDWRGDRSPLARHARGGVPDHELNSGSGYAWLDAARLTWLENACINLIGPFPTSCDHGCSHGLDNAHMAEACRTVDCSTILHTCLTTIDGADLICAHLSTPDAYGTLVEIGYAKGRRPTRPVCVTVDQALALKVERNSSDHVDEARHDLWFACDLADETAVVEDAAEARRTHAAFVRKHTSREFRRIAGIARETGAAAITFGDPFEVAQEGRSISWGVDWDVLCASSRMEAEVIRSHRFDGT